MLIGTVCFGKSTNPYSRVVLSLIISIRAAMAMKIADRSIQVPILWSIVMPEGFLLKAMGTKMRSYMGIKIIMARLIKDWRAAAGTSKPGTIVLSMVAPCLVKKVKGWTNTIAYTKLVTHIGIRLRTAFASSTSLMLHTFPSSLELFGASNALLRNLPYQRIKITIRDDFEVNKQLKSCFGKLAVIGLSTQRARVLQ